MKFYFIRSDIIFSLKGNHFLILSSLVIFLSQNNKLSLPEIFCVTALLEKNYFKIAKACIKVSHNRMGISVVFEIFS